MQNFKNLDTLDSLENNPFGRRFHRKRNKSQIGDSWTQVSWTSQNAILESFFPPDCMDRSGSGESMAAFCCLGLELMHNLYSPPIGESSSMALPGHTGLGARSISFPRRG